MTKRALAVNITSPANETAERKSPTMNTIEITLSSANMGDVDEVDFDLWTQFVTDNIDAAVGFEVASVERGRWPSSAGFDTITGATEEQRDAIREWLDVTGWNDFCGGTWTRMRREHDATT